MEIPGARLYHSGITHRNNCGVSSIPPSLHAQNKTREYNVVRQHEKPTGKHRPGVEERTSSKRCRVASSGGPRSRLSYGDGGDVGACLQSVDGGHVTIRSPSGCGQVESSDAACSIHVDCHAVARPYHGPGARRDHAEEHTSELQSLRHLVCRLLL